jgi:hypothetical protein
MQVKGQEAASEALRGQLEMAQAAERELLDELEDLRVQVCACLYNKYVC